MNGFFDGDGIQIVGNADPTDSSNAEISPDNAMPDPPQTPPDMEGQMPQGIGAEPPGMEGQMPGNPVQEGGMMNSSGSDNSQGRPLRQTSQIPQRQGCNPTESSAAVHLSRRDNNCGCLLRAESIDGQLNGTIGSTKDEQDSDTLIAAGDLQISDMGSMDNTMGEGQGRPGSGSESGGNMFAEENVSVGRDEVAEGDRPSKCKDNSK